jgi:hypothetical protein
MEGVDVNIHAFLTLSLVGSEWSASRSNRFTPGEVVPVPIATRPVRPITGVDDVDWNPDPSAVQIIANCFTDLLIAVSDN